MRQRGSVGAILMVHMEGETKDGGGGGGGVLLMW